MLIIIWTGFQSSLLCKVLGIYILEFLMFDPFGYYLINFQISIIRHLSYFFPFLKIWISNRWKVLIENVLKNLIFLRWKTWKYHANLSSVKNFSQLFSEARRNGASVCVVLKSVISQSKWKRRIFVRWRCSWYHMKYNVARRIYMYICESVLLLGSAQWINTSFAAWHFEDL